MASITPQIVTPGIDNSSVAIANPGGHRTIALGDSITSGNSSVQVSGGTAMAIGDRDYLGWAGLLSKGRIGYLRNSGVAGNTTTQMLARVNTDVIAYAPDWCIINGGTNNPSNGISQATTQSDIQNIVAALQAARIRPILTTITPTTTAAKIPFISKFNQWVLRWGASNGIPVVDLFSGLVNTATGAFTASLTTDSLHPNAAGAKVMGQAVFNALTNLYPPTAPYLVQGQLDHNLMATAGAGLFNADTNADGLADGWFPYGPGTVVYTRVADAAIKGFWQQAQKSANDGYNSITNQGANPTVTPGDRICLTGLIQTTGSGGATPIGAEPKINLIGGSPSFTNIPALGTNVDLSGVNRFYLETTAPPGTTAMSLDFLVTGIGTVKWAQVTWINLTQLGF